MKLAARSDRADPLARSRRPRSVISFDQPWAGIPGAGAGESYPPIRLADMLIRAGLGLTGFGAGDQRRPLSGRDAAARRRGFRPAIGLLVEIVGHAAYLVISVPGGTGDPTLWPTPQASLAPGDSERSNATGPGSARLRAPFPGQAERSRGDLEFQLRDSEPHDFPHGGLLDARGKAKPALSTLAAIRQGVSEVTRSDSRRLLAAGYWLHGAITSFSASATWEVAVPRRDVDGKSRPKTVCRVAREP